MTVSTTPTPGPILALPPISLAQVQDEAAFLTRIDRKYLVPVSVFPELLSELETGTRALEINGRRTFGYSTRYFDHEHEAYLRALRKRANRFKVRTRLYDDSGECHVEVKLLDGRGRTVKLRQAHDAHQLDDLSNDERRWLWSIEAIQALAPHLQPSVATHYRRSTVVFPGGTGRMTIDQQLIFLDRSGQWQRLEAMSLIEVKGPGRALPFDRFLWRNGFRPVPASKFALGVSLLEPELPAMRWHRLRRQMAPNLVQGN